MSTSLLWLEARAKVTEDMDRAAKLPILFPDLLDFYVANLLRSFPDEERPLIVWRVVT